MTSDIAIRTRPR